MALTGSIAALDADLTEIGRRSEQCRDLLHRCLLDLAAMEYRADVLLERRAALTRVMLDPDQCARNALQTGPSRPQGEPSRPLSTSGGEHGPMVVKSAQGAKGAAELHAYWTKDPRGLVQWADAEDPWTQLYHHLLKYLSDDRAKRTAAQWFHDVFHFWPGSDKNRVLHGKPPRGKVVGPG